MGRDLPHDDGLNYAERQLAYDRGRAIYEAEFDRPPDKGLWPSGRDQTGAEVFFLVILGCGLSGMTGVAMGAAVGGLTGLLLWVGVIVVILPIVLLVSHRYGGKTKPDVMANCG